MAEQQFYTILTAAGRAKLTDAGISGTKITFTHLAVGDGGGSYYNPVDTQIKLKNEVWRGGLIRVDIDPDNPNWIVLETTIPASEGGFMVREAGVFDVDNTLIAVGKYPETFKPVTADGAAKDLYIKMIIEVSNASTVTLMVDPSVMLATKEDVGALDGRVSVLETHKVKRYGVAFSGSVSKGTRVEDAVGMIAQVAVDDEIVINDFDEVPFFNRPICCGYHDEGGKFHVNAYRGEPGFAWDGSNGEVYYEETPFYWTGDLHTYVSVSATPLEGYRLSPRFKNGIDKEYSPVFWTAIVDLKPTSRSGTFPFYGSMNEHMTEARKYNSKAHTETMAARMSDYILQLVEFATKDVQTVMMGAASMPYSDNDAAVIGETEVNRIILENDKAERFVTGQTVSIGASYSSESIAKNRVVTDIVSYDDENTAIYFDGDPVNITVGNVVASRPWKNGATNVVTASSGSPVSNTSGKYPCIWRGKVDPWATAYSAICDVLIERTGSEPNYIFTPFFLPDPTKYAAGEITDDYVGMSYRLPSENGYAKTLGYDPRYPHVRITDEVGGSSTSYLAAYFYIESSYGVRAVFAGGSLISGRNCSPVYFHCRATPSLSLWRRLSRLFVSRA